MDKLLKNSAALKGAACLTVLLAALASCSLESCPELQSGDDGYRTFPLEFHILPFGEDQGAQSTKSVLEDCLNIISGINVIVYDQEGTLVDECSGYFQKDEITSIRLPSSGVFRLYFFANVPSLQSDYPLRENGMESFGYCMESYDCLSTLGLPMSYVQTVDSSAGGVISLWMERLVTRLELSFDKSSLSELHRKGSFLKSLCVCQGALDLHPFSTGGSCAESCTGCGAEADKALEADVERLNAGESVYIYLLANMQGTLLPEECSLADKTKDRLELTQSGTKLSRLSYIEAVCRLDCDDWTGENVVLRHYIGGSSPADYNCSFDIYPNRSRRICLKLCEDDPLLQAWRFENEGETLIKKYSFDIPQANLLSGFGCDVKVRAPFDFEAGSGDGNFSALLLEENFDKETESYTKTYRLNTDEPLTGLLHPSVKAGFLSRSLDFHSLTRACRDTAFPVCIYHNVFPLTLRRDSDGLLRFYGENPLGLSFSTSFELRNFDDNSLITKENHICTPLPFGSQPGLAPYPCPSDSDNTVGELPVPQNSSLCAELEIFPEWDSNAEFNMGEGNRATFGPGSGYSPANRTSGKCLIHQATADSKPSVTYIYNNVEWDVTFNNTVNDSTAAPRVFYIDDRQTDFSSYFSWGCPGKSYVQKNISGSTGHNNSANYRLEDFSACPFYITNGCLQGYRMSLFVHKWNSAYMVAQTKVYCHRPGRDLFDAGVGGTLPTGADISFNVEGKSSWGDISCFVAYSAYSWSGINLMINGCSCWPGASTLERGVMDTKLYESQQAAQ